MKKTDGKKLALNLETIAPLVLDGVNGGQGITGRTRTTTTIVSKLVCPPSLNKVCAGGGQ